MVVALGARHRQSEPGGRGALDAVEEADEPLLLGDVAALAVEDVVAVEGRGEALLGCGVRQEVAGQHLGAELVERFVGVELAHQPIPPDPLERIAVLLEAVAVGVAGGIEPRQDHALAVAGRSQQAVDLLLIGVGRAVGEEGGRLLRRGREAGQVQRHASQQGGLGRFGGECESRGLELGNDEGIDRVALPVGGDGGSGRGDERPVLLIVGAFGDPAAQQLALGRRDRAVRIGRRHDLLGILRDEALEQFALGGLARHEGLLRERLGADVQA